MLGARLLTSACVAVEKFPGTAQCLSEGTLLANLARVNSAGRSTAPGPRPKHALFQQCKLLEAPRELFGLLCHVCFGRSLPCDSTLRHRRFPLGPSILTSRASRFARVLDCRRLLIAAGCCAATAAAAGTLLLVPLLLLLGSALLLLGWCCRLLLLGLPAAGAACCRAAAARGLHHAVAAKAAAAVYDRLRGDWPRRRRRRRPTTTMGCRAGIGGNDKTRTKMSQVSQMATMTTRR